MVPASQQVARLHRNAGAEEKIGWLLHRFALFQILDVQSKVWQDLLTFLLKEVQDPAAANEK